MKNTMITNGQPLELAESLYIALLSLYPNRFQARFGAEMVQTFRDCRRMKPHNLSLTSLWFQTIADLSLSVPQEWRREIADEDSDIDYTGLMDLFMITVVVGANLLGWGLMGAAVALEEFGYEPSTTTLLTCILTLAVGAGIGVLSARIVARSGRAESNRIKV